MPRLRSKATGVVVNVDETTAGRIAHGFDPVEVKSEKSKAPAKKAASRKRATESE